RDFRRDNYPSTAAPPFPVPFPNLRLRRSSFPPPSNLHLRPRPKNRGKEGQIGKEGRISIGEEGESLQLVRAISTFGVAVEDGVEVLSTPQEPFVGMTFNSSDAARDYYNSYARHTRFSIRIDTSHESKRSGDKTKFIFWEVVHFEKEHNHVRMRKFLLTKYLNSHIGIPGEEKDFINLLHDCNIRTTQAYQIMGELYGSIAHCPYTEGKDMKATLDYFEELKKEDPDFYYNYTLDDKDRVENLFWVDDKHGLNDDERFKRLYDMRHRWVPAYFMQYFFPFLHTTTRSEGFNAVLKRYVNPKNSIYNFVQQYRKIQQRIFGKRDLQEANMVTKVSHYLTGHPLECQMKEVYTRKLGDNLIDVVPYKCCREPLYSTRTFRVTADKLESRFGEPLYGTRTFRVTANKSEGVYSCTCCKFQRDGVLCCHVMKVFDMLIVREVPEWYILPRWSA
uniref:SWIM-type domain-containing protein n=1 Tax=Setaria italica TaxID=4555 RepID=K3Y2Y0_SETIT